ncbi:hypothetical protein [Terasakiella sp. SH-1]|uniref:hypothetical protein n=1 Tax=Terasakiella sp. SH-1 TaxID=2560057 RepID=UPI0010735C3A|nr:hypothetical protein [Terasakiella sp. SH-1]
MKRLDDACAHSFEDETITLNKDDLENLLEGTEEGFSTILFKCENGQIKLWRTEPDESFVW